jgi:hypothetical protein
MNDPSARNATSDMHPLDNSGHASLPATRQIDQGCAHLPGTRHATGTGRSDVAQALGNQLAVGIVATYCVNASSTTAVLRVSIDKQNGQGKRRPQETADLAQLQFTDLLPAAGNRLEHTGGRCPPAGR